MLLSPPLSLGSLSCFQEPSGCFTHGSRLTLFVSSLYWMRKYAVSAVYSARSDTSVDPPGRFFPPTTLTVDGWAAFQAASMVPSTAGGAVAFLATTTFFSWASSGPATNARAIPAATIAARMIHLRVDFMIGSFLTTEGSQSEPWGAGGRWDEGYGPWRIPIGWFSSTMPATVKSSDSIAMGIRARPAVRGSG